MNEGYTYKRTMFPSSEAFQINMKNTEPDGKRRVWVLKNGVRRSSFTRGELERATHVLEPHPRESGGLDQSGWKQISCQRENISYTIHGLSRGCGCG
ncbi:hypothetical protein RB195_014460 [Necator americanus]|uniref:Uncharacterized protein n=1 Tax=Necator americanus TaxID=51031 RepID=A0ABR1E084_NECAM